VDLDLVSGQIVDAAYGVHTAIGPGLLESVYLTVLERELRRRGLVVERQKSVDFVYDGILFTDAYRVDLLVERVIVVELKSIEKLAKVHAKQVLTYLRLLDLRVGLLINFGAPTLKAGLRRIVNDYHPRPSSPLRINQPPRKA
jgi:GxxExxY protein